MFAIGFIVQVQHRPDDEIAAAVKAHHLANLGISRFKKFAWIYEHLLGRAITDDESRALGERFTALGYLQASAGPLRPSASRFPTRRSR